MTSAAFNLVDFDDGPTLVQPSPIFHTQVMDRRQLPPSAPYVAAPEVAPQVAPRPQSNPDATQPALRVRRDLAGTRRLAIALAIGFAFLFGLAGAFVVQTMNAPAAPSPVAARTPRAVTDRSSTLDTRSTPDTLPRTGADAPLASAPRTRGKRPNLAPPVTIESGETPPTSESESIEGRDLLGEGLGD